MEHPNFQALDENTIRRALVADVERRIEALEIIEETGSTNDHLIHETVVASGFHACLAESQTAGKGRRGRRVWHSPKNGNLYLSLMDCDSVTKPVQAAWLSLTTAVEVVSTLAANGISGLGVKWPNDICCARGDGSKLGGVLVESKAGRCVIGLGLNVYSPVNNRPEHNVAWAALDEILPGGFERCELAASMITSLVRAFDKVGRKSVRGLMEDWSRYDLLAGRRVTVLAGEKVVSGVACGVDTNGGLCVRHGSGSLSEVRIYYSDDISVRW